MKKLLTPLRVLVALLCIASLVAIWCWREHSGDGYGTLPAMEDVSTSTPLRVADSAVLLIPGQAALGSVQFAVEEDKKYLVISSISLFSK